LSACTMPKSVKSYCSATQSREEAEDNTERNSDDRSDQSRTPTSPTASRRVQSTRASDLDLRSRLPSPLQLDENSSLLASADGPLSSYKSAPSSASDTSRPLSHIQTSYAASIRIPRNHSRHGSFGLRLANALGVDRRAAFNNTLEASGLSFYRDDRVWYDQFTSTDWVHDSIADVFRVKELRIRKDLRGRLQVLFDGAQGWILVAIIGCLTAVVAYFVDITEATIFDYKSGYCTTAWYSSRRKCCAGATRCAGWTSWSEALHSGTIVDEWTDFATFVLWVVLLATLSCVLTLATKTVISSAVALSTLDENLGADNRKLDTDSQGRKHSLSPPRRFTMAQQRPPMIYYSAAGSGVAEVKVILSGFVLHGYLGMKTLTFKTLGLILSVSSGLSLGKEGPYVHIAACIGNVACRMFSKYRHNDGKRREVLSASAASGVAVAFGAPIGGVLFSLEEVSYYFPPKTLFRTFFCCIVAALSLKFLDPYGTNKIVLFEVRYMTDSSGIDTPDSLLPNCYLSSQVPCDTFTHTGYGLCPTEGRIFNVVGYLCIAFVIKVILTVITFGIKVPAGIYVPFMVVGGLLGRIVGHMVQYMALKYAGSGIFSNCPADGNPEACVVPGVYALVAAGATMCGVTRLSVTLAIILFELTGSLDHVLPFSIAVLVSKWTADALEPLSIYDLLTDMNSYPFLDNKVRPVFTTELGDITQRPRPERVIDISNSPLVHAKELRQKLEYLHMAGELDGGLPIIRESILVGLIPAPDLEFALDKLGSEDSSLCLMSMQTRWNGLEDETTDTVDLTDFTPYIDPAPVALAVHSPMDLVYECFVKLGLRYICVLRDGQYAGMVSPPSSPWKFLAY
ncbi:hypothetical protein LTR04_003652, partial [Oleoguttula sp. CCFEE 6159]